MTRMLVWAATGPAALKWYVQKLNLVSQPADTAGLFLQMLTVSNIGYLGGQLYLGCFHSPPLHHHRPDHLRR